MIDYLKSWLSPEPEPSSPAIDLFLAGASIPAIAGQLGCYGEQLIPGQRAIEAELRAYIGELESEISSLRAALDRR